MIRWCVIGVKERLVMGSELGMMEIREERMLGTPFWT